MKFALAVPLFTLLLASALAQELRPSDAKNLIVYQEQGRFAGWPANHGIWSWGDEILVGFERGYFRDNDSGHDIDYSRPAEHVLTRSLDGGRNWNFQSYMGPEPLDYSIMPSSVRLSAASIVTAVRRRNWIDVYRSNDNGDSWSLLNQAATDIGGNPPSMVQMPDGRLLMTYGYRKEPYGIHARVSENEGLTWSEPILLREDGGGSDLGYTRTVVRPDGRLVTVYYYNTDAARERFIAATIWDLNSVR